MVLCRREDVSLFVYGKKRVGRADHPGDDFNVCVLLCLARHLLGHLTVQIGKPGENLLQIHGACCAVAVDGDRPPVDPAGNRETLPGPSL
jgi:hypothetical protein